MRGPAPLPAHVAFTTSAAPAAGEDGKRAGGHVLESRALEPSAEWDRSRREADSRVQGYGHP